LNVSPNAAVTTPAAASSSVMRARLVSRRVAGGTISAAQPKPIAETVASTTTCASATGALEG